MRKLTNIIFICAAILVCTNSHAKYFTEYYGSGVKIIKVHTHGSGGLTLHISGNVINLDGCSVTSRVHLRGDLSGHDNMVSSALLAFASGKNVGLHLSGCDYIPFWGESGGLTPIVDNLWVHD